MVSLNAAVIASMAAGVAFIVLFTIMFANQKTTLPAIVKHTSEVIIPRDAVIINNPAFEPNPIKVVIGVNNTVRWVNQDVVAAWIEADNESDPAFYNATKDSVFIPPNETFEYTFTKAGEFGYHGRPWQRATVVVLPSQ